MNKKLSALLLILSCKAFSNEINLKEIVSESFPTLAELATKSILRTNYTALSRFTNSKSLARVKQTRESQNKPQQSIYIDIIKGIISRSIPNLENLLKLELNESNLKLREQIARAWYRDNQTKIRKLALEQNALVRPKTLRTNLKSITNVAINENWLVATSENKILVYDKETNTVLYERDTPSIETINSINTIENHTIIFVSHPNKAYINIWKPITGEFYQILPLGNSWFKNYKIFGNLLVATSSDESSTIFDIETMKHFGTTTCLFSKPIFRDIFKDITSRSSKFQIQISARYKELEELVKNTMLPVKHSIIYGNKYISLLYYRFLEIWNISSQSLYKKVELKNKGSHFLLFSNDKYAIISSIVFRARKENLLVYDIEKDKLFKLKGHKKNNILEAQIIDHLLITKSYDGQEVIIWSLETFLPIKVIRNKHISFIKVKDNLIIIGLKNGKIRIYDTNQSVLKFLSEKKNTTSTSRLIEIDNAINHPCSLLDALD